MTIPKAQQAQPPDRRERACSSPRVAHLGQPFEGSLHYLPDTDYSPLRFVIVMYSMTYSLSPLLEIPTTWITHKQKN